MSAAAAGEGGRELEEEQGAASEACSSGYRPVGGRVHGRSAYRFGCWLGCAATYMINIGKTWEKLMLAARVIVAIENPKVGGGRTWTAQLRGGWF